MRIYIQVRFSPFVLYYRWNINDYQGFYSYSENEVFRKCWGIFILKAVILLMLPLPLHLSLSHTDEQSYSLPASRIYSSM